MLSRAVDIREGLVFRPSLVFWRINEAAKPKTLLATSPERAGESLLRTTPTNPHFSVTFASAKDGNRYEINITPTDTSAPAACQIALDTEGLSGKGQTQHIFACVK